ncbi:MAG: hypothetical protein V3V08_18955 [Nannocystaceae bacterium]
MDAATASFLGATVGGATVVAAMFLGPFVGARAARRRAHQEDLDARRRTAIINLYGALTEVRAVLYDGVHAPPDDDHIPKAAMDRITALNKARLGAAIFVEDDLRNTIDGLRSHAWRAIAHSDSARELEAAHPKKADEKRVKASQHEVEFDVGYEPAQEATRAALDKVRGS